MERKVPIRILNVNVNIIVLTCVTSIGLGACGPIVQGATFTQRPDSVRRGSILGPFEGQVIDADTDQPLADAIVMSSWAFDRGLGSPAPEAVRTFETKTDADGRYQIPALRQLPQGLTTRLAQLSLIIYKREYVTFRHNTIFSRPADRTIFSQLHNIVRLIRWSPELSHARHLLFLGGGEMLRKASQQEAIAAALEIERGLVSPAIKAKLPLVPAPPITAPSGAAGQLEASVLLSSDEVRAVTGYQGAFTSGRLPGPHGATYDTFHLRAVDKPERYDVAIRVWRLPTRALESKYQEMLSALTDSTPTDKVGDRAFAVLQGEIRGLGFLHRSTSTVVLLTCGRGQCIEEKQLFELGAKVEHNLSRLPPPSADQSPEEEDEEQKEQPSSAPAPSPTDDDEEAP